MSQPSPEKEDRSIIGFGGRRLDDLRAMGLVQRRRLDDLAAVDGAAAELQAQPLRQVARRGADPAGRRLRIGIAGVFRHPLAPGAVLLDVAERPVRRRHEIREPRARAAHAERPVEPLGRELSHDLPAALAAATAAAVRPKLV